MCVRIINPGVRLSRTSSRLRFDDDSGMNESPQNPTPPDPAQSYERADPKNESPEGTLGQRKTSPVKRPDRAEQAVPQRQNRDDEFNGEQVPAGPNSVGELSEDTASDPHHPQK